MFFKFSWGPYKGVLKSAVKGSNAPYSLRQPLSADVWWSLGSLLSVDIYFIYTLVHDIQSHTPSYV